MTRNNHQISRTHRLNGMELLENRCLLSASPIDVGVVYYEGAPTVDGSGIDSASDYIYVSFQGGAANTELSTLTIDLARYGETGRFNFIDQGQGTYGNTEFEILGSSSYKVNDYLISENGTLLTISLDDFNAGEVLILKLDVDEMLNSEGDMDAESTGAEFSATACVSATFSARGYENVLMNNVNFKDWFERDYPGYDIAGLPNDGFNNIDSPIPPGDGEDQSVYTAGAFATCVQIPLPCSISGYVYEDANHNFEYEYNVDRMMSDVTVDLWRLSETTGEYVKVDSTTTDKDGFYSFDVEPGTYKVFEQTPNGYLDVTSFVGTIEDVPVGTQIDANTLSDITIYGGEDSVHNDFSDYRQAYISGHVYVDENYNGVLDVGEELLDGIKITLENKDTGELQYAWTDEFGFWEFKNLVPGDYEVVEVTPAGYTDGRDTIGSLGGVQLVDSAEKDLFSAITIFSGDEGIDYDFGELLYSSIAGRVWVDENPNGVWDADEKLLSDVRIELRDEQGNVLATDYTDTYGAYLFDGLKPGVYTVYEFQPEEYINGGQIVGTEGGTIAIVGYETSNIDLKVGVDAVNYDFWEYEYAQISGYVFKDGEDLVLPEGSDLPDNIWDLYPGVRDETSTPISGVKLVLADEDGNVVLDADGEEIYTYTDKNGYYCFDHVAPGNYTILEEQPDGYIDGIDTPGSLGGKANNPGGDKLSEINITYGDDGVEYNFSEIVVEWEPNDNPPPGGGGKVLPPPSRVYHSGGGSAPVTPNSYMPYFGGANGLSLGGGMAQGGVWKLGVLNGGTASANGNVVTNLAFVGNMTFDPNSWQGMVMNKIQWMLSENAGRTEGTWFGLPEATALAGDFNGDGFDELAIFLEGFWFIDYNGNRVWDDGDLWVQLGEGGDQPIVGDWDGDGKTDIGVFGRPGPYDRQLYANDGGLPDSENFIRGPYKNLPHHNRTNRDYYYTKLHKDGPIQRDVVDHVFQFGSPGDIAVTGDWNGDGIWSIGVYNNGKWTIDYDGDGRLTSADKEYYFGEKGDIPVVGKWDGAEISKIGVYRNGEWHLDIAGNGQMDEDVKVVHHGQPGDMPLVVDFQGTGTSDQATYRAVHAPDAIAVGPTDSRME